MHMQAGVINARAYAYLKGIIKIIVAYNLLSLSYIPIKTQGVCPDVWLQGYYVCQHVEEQHRHNYHLHNSVRAAPYLLT